MRRFGNWLSTYRDATPDYPLDYYKEKEYRRAPSRRTFLFDFLCTYVDDDYCSQSIANDINRTYTAAEMLTKEDNDA